MAEAYFSNDEGDAMVESIKKNSDFLNVYRHGRSHANKFLIMHVLDNHAPSNRYGITVTKKIGNSVVRHRTARLIREGIRLNEARFCRGYDIVIVARNAAKNKKCQDIEKALLHLGRVHGIVKE